MAAENGAVNVAENLPAGLLNDGFIHNDAQREVNGVATTQQRLFLRVKNLKVFVPLAAAAAAVIEIHVLALEK